MIETATVIDLQGQVLHLHRPAGASAVHIPDSRLLWQVLWQHREQLAGVAHTHPGGGVPWPSVEDLSTFSACEAGLGRRLSWWIATADQVACFRWRGPGCWSYRPELPKSELPWLPALRAASDLC